MPISLETVRRKILIALFSDDELMNSLVLKGGNALALVYQVGSRASLDMDFSIENRFQDVKGTAERIFATLKREFGLLDYVLFDESLNLRPVLPGGEQPDWWGGYSVEFKLAERGTFDRFGHDMSALRRRAEELGPMHRRTYTIDISANEFCEGKIQREVDSYAVYVYSLEMIALEKLRAICQQMEEYGFGRSKKPRARDFYDIHQILSNHDIDLSTVENRSILSAIFAAKKVPVSLVGLIQNYRAFHVADWPAVEESISGPHEDFDFYFDFVVSLAERLQAAGIE